MVPATSAASPHVTAVLVSHDGARWLPQALDALGAQTRLPDALVAVDTGSTDDSVRLLEAALGADAVTSAPVDAGFGAAVWTGLEVLAGRTPPPPDDGWVWLLHDDCAPAPDALERLLDAATEQADIGVAGPKVREWPSLRRLLEVGVSITGTGRRETGLERGEPDQGQHDDARDVLAVGTAGMLIRRRVWDELGGLDPGLPLFGDDLDLGWRVARAGLRVRVVPEAVLFHAEAATRGLRSGGALAATVRREQRRAALFVLLANCRSRALLPQYVRLLTGSLLRAVGLLLLKAPRDALDEVAAAAAVLGRPRVLAAGRRERRRTARVAPAAVRPLLPSPLRPYRDGAAVVLEVGGGVLATAPAAIPRAVAEPGPVADEAEELPPEPGPLARVLARPWATAVLLLAVLSLLAARGVLTGGELQGGALLPAPEGIADWWAAYTAGWHPVGVGSTVPAPPYVLLLGVAGVGTLGDAGLLVSVLLLGSPVLAALAAHRLLRRVGAGPFAAIWAATAYGVLPLATGAVAQGRLGTVLGTVLLPLTAAAVVSLTEQVPPLQRWIRRARAGLAAAALVAVVPVALPMLAVAALVLVLLAAVSDRRSVPAAAVSAVVVLAVPWLLGPWWLLRRVRDPGRWWEEAGLPDADVGALDPGALEVALGAPGGPGASPAWLGAGVLVAGVLALARADRRRQVVAAWTVSAGALLAAAVGVAADPGGWGDDAVTTVWVGFPLVLWTGGLLVAAAVAAHDLPAVLTGRSFGWQQPVVLLVATAAVAGPLAALAWQVLPGVDGPLRRDAPTAVPAYMTEDARTGAHPSALVLATDGGEVATTLVRADGWRVGEEPMRAAAAAPRLVDALSGLLAAPREQDLATVAAFGVGYVYLPAPVDPDLAGALDSAPGLVRAGAPVGDRAWRLDSPGGALSAGGTALPMEAAGTDGGPPWRTALPTGAGGPLTVAALPDPAWSARVDGQSLAETEVLGDAVQGFDLAGSGAGLEVQYEDRRGWLVAGQLVGLGLLVVLAAPTRRRSP